MSQIVLLSKSVDALKAFNNAISTSRLYPPETPQVANAVERGYKGVKLFLREHGSLFFTHKGDAPCICGVPLEQEVLDSFPNLIVFRQLKMLGMPKLLIGPEMDRFAFGQLLSVFSASPDKIKKEGGGQIFITSLGLSSYFPESSGEDEERQAEEAKSPGQAESQPRRIVKLQPELVVGLCGIDKSASIDSELTKKLAVKETATELLVAAIAYILQEIRKTKAIVSSPLFPVMLQRAETGIGENDQSQVARDVAGTLTDNLKEPALCVLLSQEYPKGFGAVVYDCLINALSMELLGGIFIILREQIAKAKLIGGEKSPQVEFFGQILLKLMDTGRGKQFLSTEKAKAIIREGERARRQRRLEAGIQGLLQGNTSLLKSEELVLYLPEAVTQLLERNAGEHAEKLIRSMAEFLPAGHEAGRESLVRSMAVVCQRLAVDGRWNLVDLLLESLIQTVCRPSVGETLLEKIVTLLHLVMQNSWQCGEFGRGDLILTLFFRIRTGQIGKSPFLKTIVGKVQDRGIKLTQLPKLLEDCLADPKNETVGQRLALQGPVAVRFLVEALINTDNTADRMRIIDLLTSSRSFLAPIILERLPEHMPWYAKRNLIKLLGETGGEDDAESVMPYLKHEDYRVQRETFLCLYRIGGKRRKTLLLTALDDATEVIKIELIAALASLCDEEVAAHLSQLLVDFENISEKNRTDFLLRLLDTLGRCPCQEAQKGVQAFLQLQGVRAIRKKVPEQVWSSAEKVIKSLENDLQETRRKHVQASQLRKIAMKQVAKLGKAAKTQRIITGLQQEQTVRALVAQGDLEGAKDQLLQLIEKTARARNFVQAESLRDWLVEIDQTAFSHIIQAAEIIDREKAASIDKSHLEIWSRLYDILTTEEFSALYHALKHKVYRNDEVVVSQGTLQTSLFFINTGKVKLYFDDDGGEVLVKTMGSGEIVGAGAFFDASVWTISVASVGTSDISMLKLDRMQQWSEEYPGLEAKLADFCKKFERIEESIEQSSRDRRDHERHRISGRVQTTLLDNHDQSVGVQAMVELFDISAGGISYLARISRKENARLLLGRRMRVKLPSGDKPGQSVAMVGDILAVKGAYVVENDYSVHLKFDKTLEKKQLFEIVAAAQQGSLVIR
jgi:CRP-like cAMP-binding protein